MAFFVIIKLLKCVNINFLKPSGPNDVLHIDYNSLHAAILA